MAYTVLKDESTGRWGVHGLEPTEETFDKICDMLRARVAFKFARYGDGEFNCMFGKQGMNVDRHEYFPDMGKRLNKALLRSEYMVGIQPLALTLYPEKILPLLTGLDVYNADVLHNASIDGNLQKFMDALKGRHVILVGPAHLAAIFDCVHLIIPHVNCWLEYENIRNQIAFHVEGVNNAVVLLCASMMSEVLIDDFQDEPHTFIDSGSVFDPYCGIKSRKYHFKLRL
jgi:hypothetical protein